MTDRRPSPEQLSEVLRLCTLLADRVLDTQIMGLAVPGDQTAALMRAARLLQEHEVEWPPLLTQVLHKVAKDSQQPSEPQPETELSKGLGARGMIRFFPALLREKRPR